MCIAVQTRYKEQQQMMYGRCSIQLLEAKLMYCLIYKYQNWDYRQKKVDVAKRQNVLLCFREDKEQSISEQVKRTIIVTVKQCGKEYLETTTVEKYAISPNQRETFVYKKLQEFRNSELVITDRLHAMLFAAITGTPCIAFDNCSKKVSGVYEWIYQLKYIKIVNRESDIHLLLNEFLGSTVKECEFHKLEGNYNNMAEKMNAFFRVSD